MPRIELLLFLLALLLLLCLDSPRTYTESISPLSSWFILPSVHRTVPPSRTLKCEEMLLVPSDEASGDVSLDVTAIIVAADEAIAEADVGGLEPAWIHRMHYSHACTPSVPYRLDQRAADFYQFEIVSLEGLSLKTKNLLKTIYCGDNCPGTLVNLWGLDVAHAPIPAADVETGFWFSFSDFICVKG